MITKDFELPFAPDTYIGFVSGFVMEAGSYESKIGICFDDKYLDAKSFMGLIYASTSPRTRFTLIAEGKDEQQAMEQLSAYIDRFQ